MIRLERITKSYIPKKGIGVKAIENINLEFDDCGMVFIVGKSGSGKSTLLNIMSGLDQYDEGEMMLHGLSTKDFKQKDYDLYRNHNIGFIFQEYNLLDELNVEENIELALNLQGLKIEKEVIEKLLDQLDLHHYQKRYPNELSSGQKQRVAIARALVKNPYAIFADEPTGALDSATGKQILDVLKKLSKDKLIIVVSHDKESAMQYGDRIIELADGKVIHDECLSMVETREVNHCVKNKKPRLPLLKAIQFGMNSIKTKPMRLIFTILLSVIAFTLFGVLDVASNYKKEQIILNSMKRLELNYISYSNVVNMVDQNGVMHIVFPGMNDTDIKYLQSKFPNNHFISAYQIHHETFKTYQAVDSYAKDYYHLEVSGGIELSDSLLKQLNVELVYGNLPKEDHQIVISLHIFHLYKEYGYDSSTPIVNDYSSLMGKSFFLQDGEYEIVGVIDTHFNMERYQKLLDQDLDTITRSMLESELRTIFQYGLHNAIYFNNGYLSSKKSINKDSFIFQGEYELKLLREENTIDGFSNISLYLDKAKKLYLEKEDQIDKLNQNEVILPLKILNKIEFKELPNFYNLKTQTILSLIEEFVELHFDEIKNEFYGDKQDYIYYIDNCLENYYHPGYEREYFEDLALKKIVRENYLPNLHDFHLQLTYFGLRKEYSVKVVGFYEDLNEAELNFHSTLIASNEVFQSIVGKIDYPYEYVLTPLSDNDNQNLQLIYFSYQVVDGKRFPMHNEISVIIDEIDIMIARVNRAATYAGIGVATFAAVLLFHFISISISYRKKEIGILRAIGASEKDVLRVFISESFILAFFIFLLSFIAIYVSSFLANQILSDKFLIQITFFTVSLRQILLLLCLSFTISFLSTYIPIKRFSLKKPIDVIKSL